jgi:hypothetical protein
MSTFSITVKTNQDLKVFVSSIGFNDKILFLNNEKKSENFNLGAILLSPASYHLNGAEVRPIAAI